MLPDGQTSVFGRDGNKAVMASHLFQHLRQATEVAIGEMLGLPQVQDHACGTWFGGKVVQIPEWKIDKTDLVLYLSKHLGPLKLHSTYGK